MAAATLPPAWFTGRPSDVGIVCDRATVRISLVPIRRAAPQQREPPKNDRVEHKNNTSMQKSDLSRKRVNGAAPRPQT